MKNCFFKSVILLSAVFVLMFGISAASVSAAIQPPPPGMGIIRIVKNVIAIPNSGDNFFFDVVNGATSASVMAQDGSVPHIQGNGSILLFAAPGTYSVTERPNTGHWIIDSENGCTGLTVVAGQASTCTINNRIGIALHLIKLTIGGNDTFSFNAVGAAPSYRDIMVQTQNGGNISTLLPLDSGTYNITENAQPAGWTLTSFECTKGEERGRAVRIGMALQNGVQVTLRDADRGSTVTCTFTDTKNAPAAGVSNTSTTTALNNFESFLQSFVGGGIVLALTMYRVGALAALSGIF